MRLVDFALHLGLASYPGSSSFVYTGRSLGTRLSRPAFCVVHRLFVYFRNALLAQEMIPSILSQDEELVSLNDRVRELNLELAESKGQRETYQQEMELLRKELDEAKDRVASLESRNQKLSDEIEHVRAENVQKSNVTEDFTKKSEELLAATEELRRYRAENNVLSAKVETLMAEIERERAKAAELEDRLVRAKKLCVML